MCTPALLRRVVLVSPLLVAARTTAINVFVGVQAAYLLGCRSPEPVLRAWPGHRSAALVACSGGTVTVLATGGYLRDLSDRPRVSKFPEVVSDAAEYRREMYNAIYGVKTSRKFTTKKP